MPYPSPKTSTSDTSLSSTPPRAAVSIPHKAYFPTSPYLAPNPAFDSVLPTGLPICSHALMSRSALSPSCSESHCSKKVLTAPGTSPGRTSVPDLGTAAAEDDGKPKLSLRNENDALGPPSANRAIHATPDLPP
ncbi:hypothetical protein H4582DRAFT_2076324 [Lactarius indigo]|nr:hypothetical protein H4582DRAFT_2076324 [Lactarius indigo]